MDSFANTDRTYSDGQRNKEAIPDEIATYGFKPPVKLPDGSIELGDFLASNHLNYILNDIYNQLQNGGITESVVSQDAGYRKYADGRIELWGVGGPNASGVASVTYPIQIPGRTMQIFFTRNVVGPTAASRDIIVSGSTTTGFTVLSSKTVNGTTSADTSTFCWRAFYDPIKAAS